MSVDTTTVQMEVPLNKIRISDYCLCDEIYPSILDRIQEVCEEQGQSEPIVVRSVEEGYEVVVGRHRVEAARELSWKEIQVSAKPINNNNYNVKNGNEIQSDIRKEEIGEFCRVLS